MGTSHKHTMPSTHHLPSRPLAQRHGLVGRGAQPHGGRYRLHVPNPRPAPHPAESQLRPPALPPRCVARLMREYWVVQAAPGPWWRGKCRRVLVTRRSPTTHLLRLRGAVVMALVATAGAVALPPLMWYPQMRRRRHTHRPLALRHLPCRLMCSTTLRRQTAKPRTTQLPRRPTRTLLVSPECLMLWLRVTCRSGDVAQRHHCLRVCCSGHLRHCGWMPATQGAAVRFQGWRCHHQPQVPMATCQTSTWHSGCSVEGAV